MTIMKPTTSKNQRTGAVLAALLLSAGIAAAQTTANPDKPAPSQPAKTIKPVPQNKVSNSIQHGTDTAGRSISHADAAARNGINRGSEAASRPVRNLGDSIGRKLGLGPTRSGPAVGPQGESP